MAARSSAAAASLNTPAAAAATPPIPARGVHLTPAQVRELRRYLTPEQIAQLDPVIEKPRKRNTRKAVPASRDDLSVCHTCGAKFAGETAAARHCAEYHHHRYQWDPS